MPLTTDDIVQMQQLAARYCHAADSGHGKALQATACYQNAVRRGRRTLAFRRGRQHPDLNDEPAGVSRPVHGRPAERTQ